MALEFLDTSGSGRLALFSQTLDVISSGGKDPRTIYLTLVEILRQAFSRRCYVEVATEGLPTGSFRLTRIWRENGSEAIANNSPWQTAGVPIRSGGVIAEVLARDKAVAVNRLNIPPGDPVYGELGCYKSLLATPGGVGEHGNWVFIFENMEDAFTEDDVAYLMLRVNLIGLSLKNIHLLRDLQRATADVDAEVDRMAEIQKALLPPPNPSVPGLDVAAMWATFDRAGGDAYDYTELPNGRWGFLISDASGHGPSAAVVSAIINAVMHTLPFVRPVGEPGPATVLRYANVQLASKRIGQSFVTAFICGWDPNQRTLKYARAGHNPPILVRRGEATLLDAVGDIPLGILDEVDYHEATLPLEPDDVILLFTDGIVESIDAAGEMFGLERLTEALIVARGSAAEMLSEVTAKVHSHQCGSRSRDDQTMLLMKVLPDGTGNDLPLSTD